MVNNDFINIDGINYDYDDVCLDLIEFVGEKKTIGTMESIDDAICKGTSDGDIRL